VATDDVRIVEAVKAFGGEVLLTSSSCNTGTERVIEAYQQIQRDNSTFDIIVNIQGDEPCVDPNHIDAIVLSLQASNEAVMSTAVAPIINTSDLSNRNVVKCVFDQKNYALYFSRAMIPHSKSGLPNPATTYYRHIGIYAFRDTFLNVLPNLDLSSLEATEELEQLRVLQSGYRIKIATVDHCDPGVDTKEDLEVVTAIFKERSHVTCS